MLSVSLALAATLLIVSRHVKGPLWATSLAWIVCIAPISLGIISYRFHDVNDPRPGLIIMAAMLAFAGGVGVELFFKGRLQPSPPHPEASARDFAGTLPLARFCWFVGIAGGACLVLDFLLNGGGSLLNLAELRDSFVSKDTASVLARVTSVMTWACLFSYLFAIIFRRELGIRRAIFFALPIVAYMGGAILTAGRQAAFQLIIITIVGQYLWRLRNQDIAARGRGGSAFVLALTGALVAYMGYVAIARNDSRISDIKSEVLARLFDFTISPPYEKVFGLFGSGVFETIMEALVYFSSSIALFSRFLIADLDGVSHGAMNFPFIFRQAEALTGVNVADMYQIRVAAFEAQQVIGVGWATAISNLIMDFGLTGSLIFLAVQGFMSSVLWRAAISGGTFVDCVLGTLAVVGAVYLPLIPAFSDNNLLLLLIMCLAVKMFDIRRRQARSPVIA